MIEAVVDTCPVCGGFLKMENQVIETRLNPHFFSGLGHCFCCGRMRVSGRIEHGLPRIVKFIPFCECCHSEVPVNRPDPAEMRWACELCGMAIEARHKRLWRIPSPSCQLRVLAAV